MADDVESFYSTGTRVMGGVGLVFVLALAITGLVDSDAGFAPWGIALCVFSGVVLWVTLVRPSLQLSSTHLAMRNMVGKVSIPLARIDSVAVQQIMVVRVGEKRYVSAAVGRSRRQLGRDAGAVSRPSSPSFLGGPRLPMMGQQSEGKPRREYSYGYFVEEKIRTHVVSAVDRAAGVDADVVMHRAWPEIIALVVTGVALVVLLVV